jgi:uncharacterized protein YdhG (YjbR/CyaY superfamily)
MAQGAAAATPSAYLAALPPDRRSALTAVRKVIRKHLPRGYEEGIGWGMITYTVPLARYAGMGQPACYVALAAQKNYCSLHLMSIGMNPAASARLRAAFGEAGKKMNMGKACIRFKDAADLPLDAIGALVAETSVDDWIAVCDAGRRRRR